MSILLGLLNLALILISVSLVLVVLMQKTKDGGMGATLGGGATESAFGHETGNVLSKFTINAAIAFFVLAFALYLGRIYQHKHTRTAGDDLLQKIAVPAAPARQPLSPMPAPASSTGSAPTAPAAAATTTPSAPMVTLPVPAAGQTAPVTAPKPATP